MSGIQVNLLRLVMELIIYSDGQSLRTSFQKKQGSCISVYKYIHIYIYTLYTYNYIYPDAFPSE